MAYDRMMHKANGGCPSEIIEPPSPCGSEGDPCEFAEIPAGFSRWVNRKEADNTGWEGELPPLHPWRPGLSCCPAHLALCDSDGDSGAEDDGGGEGGSRDSGREEDGAGGGSNDGADGCNNAVDTNPNPAFTWDDVHWNNLVRPTQLNLPQARVRFRTLRVRRDGTVRTNLWT